MAVVQKIMQSIMSGTQDRNIKFIDLNRMSLKKGKN